MSPHPFPAMAIVRELALPIDGALAKRLNAHIDRIEESEPGLGRAPGESTDDTLRVAIGALLDRGLREAEADDGVRGDALTGELRPLGRAAVRVRLRRAWRVLRGGW